MPSEETKILEFNQHKISDKAPFIIHSDLECLVKKTNGCKNNPENSSSAKEGKNIPSDFSMSTILSFKTIENKHDEYKSVDWMNTFCESLRKHTTKTNNLKKKNEVIDKRVGGNI